MTLADDGQVAVVPARAAGLSAGKAFVVARRNGKTERVPVEVIASSGAEALVKGILPGVEVAADASLDRRGAGSREDAVIAAFVRWSVRHRVLVVFTTLALMAAGALVGMLLKFDALPDITTNQVLVLTRAPGLTPEEVERRVSAPDRVGAGGVAGAD